MPRIAALLCALLVPAAVRADERWTVSADVRALSAPVLPGIVLGAALQGRHALAGPWRASLQLAGGSVSDANASWSIDQTHLLAAAGLGLVRTIGVAQLSADLQAGALVIQERARRHQFERLTAAEMPDRERSATMAAPFAQLELAAAVELRAQWRLRLALGPQLSWPSVNDARSLRPGLFTAVGVEHAF